MSTGYREKCLKEKGECCHICGSDGGIEVHHIDGDRSNNDIDNLIPVCYSCHWEIHNGDGLEEWSDKILPDTQRTRSVSITLTPDDSTSIQALKEIHNLETATDVLRHSLEEHSDHVSMSGERWELLAEMQQEYDASTESILLHSLKVFRQLDTAVINILQRDDLTIEQKRAMANELSTEAFEIDISTTVTVKTPRR